MNLLKRENWWVWLFLTIMTGSSALVLAALLNCLDKDAWYAKWYNWLLGFLLFCLPLTVMLVVFNIDMLTKVAAKLGVKGTEFYLSPFIWIICLIVPILGWLTFILMFLYLLIMIIVKLKNGYGEKYI